MPAVDPKAGLRGVKALDVRRWDQHDNRSIITPTALAFLIPIIIVFFFAPFLCVFCIRKRRRDIPIGRRCISKVPALQRPEAKARLQPVVEVLQITGGENAECAARYEAKLGSDGASALGEECAICLSTLHALAVPEPAKLSLENGIAGEATRAPAKLDVEEEEVFKLRNCGHGFHSYCLISWAMLCKTSCPVCRTVFYCEEPEKATDPEARTSSIERSPVAVEQPAPSAPPSVTNWYYLSTDQDARRIVAGTQVRSSWWRFDRFRL